MQGVEMQTVNGAPSTTGAPATASLPPVSTSAPAGAAAPTPAAPTPAAPAAAASAPAAGDNKEWKNVDSFKGATFNSTVINIINTIVGAGVLSIAYSIMKGGVIGSILLIIAVFIPSIFTAYYLSVATLYTGKGVYGDVGTALSNKTVGILSNLSLVLLDFGIDVAYMSVLFNQVIDIIHELFGVDLEKYRVLISILITLLILFPLISIKNMDTLKFTSTIAIICVIIFVIACIFMGIKGFGERGWDLKMWPSKATDLSSAFAVFVLCFCSHVSTTTISAELKWEQGKSKFANKAVKVLRATIVAYVFCACAYLFVGICGYMAFGNDIKGSILDAMRTMDVWYRPVVRIGYGLVVMFSYPILGFSAVTSIDAMIFSTERNLTRRLSEGFIYVAICLVVCLLIPELSTIFGVTGNFCGVLVTFIWPALYFIMLANKEKKLPADKRKKWLNIKNWEVVVAWIIFVVGIICCIYATTLEIINIATPAPAPSVEPTANATAMWL
jgi:singapore isolate B (sub-type 7) whole genome shotgun sequence assembly, scaffold_5